MHFTDLIEEVQQADVFGQIINRAKFGNHIRLAELQTKIDKALINGRSSEASTWISAYFFICDFDSRDLSGEELLIAFYRLCNLNKLRYVLAFQNWQGKPAEPVKYDYPGRQWAWWIHKIASRYGWSKDEIFNLWPEEAAAYLQEILVAEYHENEQRRWLSEIPWESDRLAKKRRYKPLPKPGWMSPEEKPEVIVRVHKSRMPVGNIINLDEYYQ